MKCRLCLNEKKLKRSHIIPESLHQPLKNEKNHFMGIHGIGGKGWKPLQNGLKEELLCGDCEQHLNRCYELPFLNTWVRNSPLPSPFRVPEPYAINVDYKVIKLMCLSILFRASVSSLSSFRAVSLGKHSEIIRTMLLNEDPAKASQYPLLAVVLRDKNDGIAQIISCVQKFRFQDLNGYKVAYAGAEWWCFVASHRNREVESVCLRENGMFPLISERWENLGVVRAASVMLKGKSP